jgi:hypothetical protein
MDDFVSFVLYPAGFIVSIIVIVALCQLFAIRRGIEALVKLQSPGGTPPGVTQPAIVPAVVPAQRILDPPTSLSP